QERAFLYELAFPRQGTPPAARALLTPDLFIHAPRVVRAGDPCPVHLVVDNARSGIKLEVAQDRNNTGKFQPRPPLRDGDRQRQTLFTPTGPDGGLLFRTSVKDWVVNDLDTDIPDGTWAIQ